MGSSGRDRSLAALFGEDALAVDTQVTTALRTRGVFLVASAGFLWSTLGLGVRLMEEATAWQIVFYRGVFQAAAVTGLVLHRNRGRIRHTNKGGSVSKGRNPLSGRVGAGRLRARVRPQFERGFQRGGCYRAQGRNGASEHLGDY